MKQLLKDAAMTKLVPFKLDPALKSSHDPQVQCADCGRMIEFGYARIAMMNVPRKKRNCAAEEISLDELAQDTVWTILCHECWRQQLNPDQEPERIH